MDVTEASKVLWAKGERILQGNRLGATDTEHVEALAAHMSLNGERNVGDFGCGFGEVSRLLSEKLPDAKFWLVNQNEWQLTKCPETPQFYWFCDDMTETTLPDGALDYIMFNWSLCHVNTVKALKEAYRITNGYGRLFIYDLERVSGNNAVTKALLNAEFISDSEFREACAATGWMQVETLHPIADDTKFRRSFSNDAVYEEIAKDLRPIIWTTRK